MRIAFFYGDIPSIAYNSSYWRCEVPCRALKAAGHEALLMPLAALPGATGLDLVIIEREMTPGVLRVMQDLQSKGMKVVVTFDDAYHAIPRSNWGANYWKRNLGWNREPLPFNTFDTFTAALRQADAFITPSVRLTEHYKRYNRKALTVENFIDESWVNEEVAEPDYDLGWSTSIGHNDALRESKLLNLFKVMKWSLVINSSSGELLQELSGLYDMHVPWTKQGRYLQDAVSKFRVGLAPVVNDYDQFRSHVKALGYAAAGRPCVMTESHTFRFAPGAHVKNTLKGWQDGIALTLDHWEEASQQAKDWAHENTIQHNLSAYTDLLEKIG